MAAERMPNILYLSDLHFGYDKDATARDLRAESLDLLVKQLKTLDTDWKPGILSNLRQSDVAGTPRRVYRTYQVAPQKAVPRNRSHRRRLYRLSRQP